MVAIDTLIAFGGTAGDATLGAVAGHAAAGMSRHDLKELGEHLDAGTAGLVVPVSDMGANVEQAMDRAAKLEADAPRSSATPALLRGARADHESNRCGWSGASVAGRKEKSTGAA